MKNKTRLILGIILLSLFTLTLSMRFVVAASEWGQTYGQSGDDEILSAVQTSDGGYALGGFTNFSGAGSYDFWLVKTDANGTRQWNKTYGGSGDDEAYSVIQTRDGGYALAGYTYSFGAGETDAWLVKTDANGNMVWNQTFGGRAEDQATAVIQTSDGGYALAGYTNSSGAGSYDFWLVKTDANGTALWSHTYGDTGDEFASAVVQTSDGGYALAGPTDSYGAGDFDFWLVKTDASGNMQQWNKTYGGSGDDEPFALILTSDGGYALAGFTSSFGAGIYEGWLVKTDSSGNTVISQSSSPFPISLQTIAIIVVIAIIIILIAALGFRRGRSRSSANPPAPTSPI